MNNLKNRGLEDILIAVEDGLKRFPDAINAAYPDTTVQTCIVHLVHHSLNFCGWKDRKEVAKSLKRIYRAVDDEAAAKALDDFEAEWGNKYPSIAPSWRRAWQEVIPFFAFPPDVRKIIYTTNAIESLNRVIRKTTKTRGSFPTDDVVLTAWAKPHTQSFGYPPRPALSTAADIDLPLDLAEETSVTAFFTANYNLHDRVYAVINSGGILQNRIRFTEMPVTEFDQVWNSNVRGTLLINQAFGRSMMAAGIGSIINMCSLTTYRGSPQPAYAPAKIALKSMTETMAADFGPSGVRVNAVARSYTSTPVMKQRSKEGSRDPRAIIDNSSLKRQFEPGDVAEAVFFLCSDAGSAITGVTLPVDGVWLAYSGYTAYASRPTKRQVEKLRLTSCSPISRFLIRNSHTSSFSGNTLPDRTYRLHRPVRCHEDLYGGPARRHHRVC
jgi:NAD(P)-dependent dehydrogenase (short-subunit alcohol dehydrogenase family)